MIYIHMGLTVNGGAAESHQTQPNKVKKYEIEWKREKWIYMFMYDG